MLTSVREGASGGAGQGSVPAAALLGVCLNDQEEESGVSVKTDGDGKSHKRESQLVRLSDRAINSR